MNGLNTNWESPGSQSSQSRAGGTGRQIHVLRPLALIDFVGSSEGAIGDVSFRVEIPDSRLRCNIALIGSPLAGASATFIGTKGLTLWLRSVIDGYDTGVESPVTDLWGTSGGGDPIPGRIDPTTGLPVAETGLGGFALETITAGNAIRGTVTYPAQVNTGRGQLVLQVRYAPEAGVRFPWDEWDEIRRACGCSLVGLKLDGGA